MVIRALKRLRPGTSKLFPVPDTHGDSRILRADRHAFDPGENSGTDRWDCGRNMSMVMVSW